MMKVLFVDQSAQPGGAELCLLDLIKTLKVQSRVFLFEDGPFRHTLQANHLNVVTASKRISLTKRGGLLQMIKAVLPSLRLLFRLLAEAASADLIYANTPKAWVLAALAAKLARKPLVCHLHDIISPSHFGTLNRKLLIGSANWAARAVIANSSASAQAFVQQGGRSTLLTVIPNGFDLDQFQKGPDDETALETLKASMGIPPHAQLVGMIGRISPWKGQHVLIEALEQLHGVHGLIVGDALFTEEDRSYARNLKNLSIDLGLASRIHFTGFRDEVVALMKLMEIVVHASVAPEPFGRVIVEAMLCEKPVIVSDHGGAVEIVEHDVTGRHHRAGDADDLARQLKAVLNHPTRARELAVAGAISCRARYNLTETATATQLLLEAVLKNQHPVSQAQSYEPEFSNPQT